MSDTKKKRSVFLAMPGYGKQTSAAGRAFWRCCAPGTGTVNRCYQNGSLLACNMNKAWCEALNFVHGGGQLDYFAMLHDDIGAEDFWLDTLIEELEAKKLDVLGVVVPIKDFRGVTSIALHHEGDNWNPECRLTMNDVFQLPETFTQDDVDGMPLLLNTGCWVAKWDQAWARQLHFEINDRIVFNRADNRYVPEVESEDWFFSRMLNELGLRIGATRKIQVRHEGEVEFTNSMPWGSQAYDVDSQVYPRKTSPVPGAFPQEIPGWLTAPEGAALAELARGKRVLEIGSYCGLSTVCMARTAKHVTAVDYFDGRGTPSPKNTRPDFDHNMARYGVASKVATRSPDEELPAEAFDVAFIDGAHDRESVAADAARCIPSLKAGGLLAFHDYKQPCHPGIEEAVKELISEGGELISVTDTLAVVRPPARVPQEV